MIARASDQIDVTSNDFVEITEQGNSLFQWINSLFARNEFPVPARREFACNAPELLRELTSGSTEMAGNLQNSLLFSLL